MFILAMALMAVGYTIAYWGANNIKHWDGPTATDAAPLALLFGVTDLSTNAALRDDIVIHPVPFPYNNPADATATKGTSGTVGGATTTSKSVNGSGDTITTTSPIPAGTDVQGGNYKIPGT